MQEKLRLLEQMIDERGLSDAKAQIMALVRPAIALIPEIADENEIHLGSTKLWGLPHVPLGFDWPTHEGMMLGFLGQVNRAELKRCYDLGLPNNGLLSFWFHQGLDAVEGAAYGKVFHFSDNENVADQSEGCIYFLYPEANLAQHNFENPYISCDLES